MKFHIVLSIVLFILATTTQGLLKSAIARKLPLLVSAVGGIKSSLRQNQNAPSSAGSITTLSGSIDSSSGSFSSSYSEQQPIETLSAAIPPAVTLYQYPTEHQVIYRSIRPVVRRTIYVQEPAYSNRALFDGITSLLPSNPITGALSSLKSTIGGLTGLTQPARPARATLSISTAPAVQAFSVPASRQVYYL